MAITKFQPPPTYAMPVIEDKRTKQSVFNPIWLKWFLDLSQNLGTTGAGGGTVTSVSALVLGTAGTNLNSAVASGTTTPVITLNVPTASATHRGALSAADWSTFNGKQPAGDYLTPSAPVTKTADFTVAVGETWLINNKASACVVTLPAAASFPGRSLTFQNYQAFTLSSATSSVVPKGGGAVSAAILPGAIGSWATLVSDGTNWVIMQAAA